MREALQILCKCEMNMPGILAALGITMNPCKDDCHDLLAKIRDVFRMLTVHACPKHNAQAPRFAPKSPITNSSWHVQTT